MERKKYSSIDGKLRLALNKGVFHWIHDRFASE